MPKLYVSEFFSDLKNEIDIEFYKNLNETNKERVNKHHVELIDKVQEFESLCLGQINVDSESDLQVKIEQIEADLNGLEVSVDELDRVNTLLSNELLEIQKNLFQDKCMIFVKVGEFKDQDDDEDDEDGWGTQNSLLFHLQTIKSEMRINNLLGLLIVVEDCFIRKEIFNKKYAI
jgi:hypothetical protein